MSLTTKLFNFLRFQQSRTENEQLFYWLKISTKVPKCIYYFGPFDSHSEARSLQGGYIEDLMEENAQGIHIELEHCSQPTELTACEPEN